MAMAVMKRRLTLLANIRNFIPFAGLLLCLLLSSSSAQAQVFPRGNGIALAGINRFDLYVEIRHWAGMTEDQTGFRLNTQRIFEAGLRSAGISRRAADRHYLVCSLQVTAAGELLAYTTALEYWSIKSTDVHALLWENSTLDTVPKRQFNEELVAAECLQYFTEEWSKWNPS